LTVKDSTLKSLQEQTTSLNQQLAVEKSKQLHHSDLIKRLQRKLLLVTKVWLCSEQNIFYHFWNI